MKCASVRLASGSALSRLPNQDVLPKTAIVFGMRVVFYVGHAANLDSGKHCLFGRQSHVTSVTCVTAKQA